MPEFPAQLWNLIYIIFGAVLGVVLGEGARRRQEKGRIRRLKNASMAELRSIKSQIKHKETIIQNTIQAFGDTKSLPMLGVPAVCTVFDTHFGELCVIYSGHKWNCLYVIYNQLRSAEQKTDLFYREFMISMKNDVVERPWDIDVSKLEDVIREYDNILELIDSFLAGQPPVIFTLTNNGSEAEG